MPTPNLHVTAEADPFACVPPALRSSRIDVLYVTDRRPRDHKNQVKYGPQRSDSMAFGSCIVQIGDSVSWEDLVRASRTKKRSRALPLRVQAVEEQARFPATPLPVAIKDGVLIDDPETRVRQQEVEARFQAELRRRLRTVARKEAFVFVHGHNNSFEDACMVIAELWHFLGRQGVPIAYTWPAGQGGMLGYLFDRESGEFTIYHLKQFLRLLDSCPELKRTHIIAHSRGTDVTLTAAREMVIESRGVQDHKHVQTKLDNLVLAAPDLDVQVLQQRVVAERILRDVGKVTIYVSERDRAIGLAEWMFSSIRRLGQLQFADLTEAEKQMMSHVDWGQVVDVKVRTDFIGHSYFHTSPAVSSDLILILRDDRDPGAAHGRPLIPISNNYWELPEGYPTLAAGDDDGS